MSPIPAETALQSMLNAAFDGVYMELLEQDEISLDDELQGRLREVIVTEVYGVLCQECERMALEGEALSRHFEQQGIREVSRRLRQELQQEDAFQRASSDESVSMLLMPAFEKAEH